MSETLESVAIDVDQKQLAEQLLAQAEEQVQPGNHPGHQLPGMTHRLIPGKTRRDAIQHRGELRLPTVRVCAVNRGDPATSVVFTNSEDAAVTAPTSADTPNRTNPDLRLQY